MGERPGSLASRITYEFERALLFVVSDSCFVLDLNFLDAEGRAEISFGDAPILKQFSKLVAPN